MFDGSNIAWRRFWSIATYSILIVVAATMVFPLAWMLATSLKAPSADVMNMTWLLPRPATALTYDDVRDYPGLCRRLIKAKNNSPANAYQRIWERLPDHARRTLERVSARGQAQYAERTIIWDSLNQLIMGGALYESGAYADVKLKAEAAQILLRSGEQMTPELTSRLNRLLLEACFPNEIRRVGRLRWRNYRTAWVEANIAKAFLNSTVVSGTIVFGQLLTSSLAAFAFARLRFFGRDKLFLAYLATMMVPTAVTIIPVFILLRQLHWINTYQALIMPSVFTAYGTFMLRQFFLTIPRELEEAALIDGCSLSRIYWHVALPLSKPGLAALGILSFMAEWKSFMWPLIVTHTQEMYTLPVALVQFQDRFGVQWTLLMAGSVIMILPMLIVFVAGQRFFVAGIRLGALKG